MQQAESQGRDPEEELRQVVSRTVVEGVAAGYEMSRDDGTPRIEEDHETIGVKRPRLG